MPTEPYQPIACSTYDLYEIAIMRGEVLELVWHDEQDELQQARITPIGLQTLDGQEFLLFRRFPLNSETVEMIRLDKIELLNNKAP